VKFDLAFDRTYPHRLEKVWHVLTDREALGSWLMETDFEPVAGGEFQMWCDDGEGGTDRYLCKVLELEPPTRMVWSWILDGREGDEVMTVEFRLEAVSGGTRLMVRHRGDRDRDTIEKFKGGWPYKLEQLATVVDKL